MQYFDIPTIKAAIERLQDISANWLLPAFVFAANDVGTDGLVDMSQRLGTDRSAVHHSVFGFHQRNREKRLVLNILDQWPVVRNSITTDWILRGTWIGRTQK